jgi:D-proline reductase (dithiol) PrdB
MDPTPWAPLLKPLSQCRLALVTTAGLVPPGAEAFDESVRGGDYSFRVIPAETELRRLRDCHRSETFDHAGMRQDANLVFPLERIFELAQRGRIDSVNRRHLSFMGSITAPGRLTKESAPEAARLLVQDEVDVALLVPV